MSAKKTVTKNTYEALLICKPVLDLDSVDTVLESFKKNLLEPKEGEVIKVDKIGRKRLAYEMNKFRDAFMMLVYFNMPPQNVAEFRRLANIQEDFLRIVLTRIDDLSLLERQPERLPERPERGGPGGFGQGGFDRGGDRPFRNNRPQHNRDESVA